LTAASLTIDGKNRQAKRPLTINRPPKKKILLT
jgi:hypothetical protein